MGTNTQWQTGMASGGAVFGGGGVASPVEFSRLARQGASESIPIGVQVAGDRSTGTLAKGFR